MNISQAAYRIFMKHQLDFAVEEGRIDLTEQEKEKFIAGAENDPDFHERLAEFLAVEIEDFGDNYGIY